MTPLPFHFSQFKPSLERGVYLVDFDESMSAQQGDETFFADVWKQETRQLEWQNADDVRHEPFAQYVMIHQVLPHSRDAYHTPTTKAQQVLR